MLVLTIGLPPQRNRCGTLTLAREEGEVLIDAVPVAGLASSALATRHGNAARSPELPYGNAPNGTFKLAGIYASGDRTRLPARHFGPHGIIALQAVSGQALIAKSAGRGPLLIHGGPPGPHESLRSTAGALRLANADMLALRALLKEDSELSCLCFTDDENASALAYDDPHCSLSERLDPNLLLPAPPVTQMAAPTISRRGAIRNAGAAFIVPLTFMAAIPEVGLAQSY
jgi:hypothetical protein